MGKLIDGEWITDERLKVAEAAAYEKSGGQFERGSASFRHWITADGGAGRTGDAGYKAEPDRYHLFAALNCPWAHRTLIYRNVKSLNNIISVSLATPARSNQGWVFNRNEPRFADTLFDFSSLHQLYTKAQPDFTGRVTVPVLWDKKTHTIVNNESSDIIRMFNSAFNTITDDQQDFYPHALTNEIDKLNVFIFNRINNGVYKAGFARTQEAYEAAVVTLFDALNTIEKQLENTRYLLGPNITEADWRLLPTLVRFDSAYVSAFKCNLYTIGDYPRLSAYLSDLYQQRGVADTVDLDVYRAGYHSHSELRNPHGIVPVGPVSSFAA